MMHDNTAAQLHAAVAAVCPIHGVSIGRKDDKSTWRIDFADGVSDAQRSAAVRAMLDFDTAAAAIAEQAKRDRATAVDAKTRELAEAMVDDPTLLDKLVRAQ
jgi:hypothetical protein